LNDGEAVSKADAYLDAGAMSVSRRCHAPCGTPKSRAR